MWKIVPKSGKNIMERLGQSLRKDISPFDTFLFRWIFQLQRVFFPPSFLMGKCLSWWVLLFALVLKPVQGDDGRLFRARMVGALYKRVLLWIHWYCSGILLVGRFYFFYFLSTC
ncbi:hypothetical protein AVEN_37962-1 [Araneus ventricosus]|uniref:Uncharacterized protein n=1 Tax=Araneus ventricosus TaxID=182803 RepID=A0A4Y2PRF4_ARAVE|nr:hypothetical protein AVEN_37962-1 [Araneus ventricosus]